MNTHSSDSEVPEISKDTLRPIVHTSSAAILFFATVVILASALTLPFPFVRKIWMKEIWGYYGLLNGALLVLVARSMKRFFFPSIAVGVGVVLFESAITWRGFLFLYRQAGLDLPSLLYITGSFASTLVLLALLAAAGQAIWRYRSVKASKRAPLNASVVRGCLAASYVAALFLFIPVLDLHGEDLYASLRLLGYAVSVAVFFGLGFEVDLALRAKKFQWPFALMTALHLVCYLVISWQAFSYLPLDQVIIQNS